MSDKLGPVELEFTIGKQVHEDAKKLQENISGIGSTSQRSAAHLKEAIQEQRNIIKGIEGDIKKMEQQMKRTAPGQVQNELTQELQAAKRALEEEMAALNGLDQDLKKSAASTRTLITRKRELLETIAALEMAGKRESSEYNQARAELARLTDAYGDASAQARIMAHDNQQLQGVISGVSGLTGALSAGAGALGLFSDNSEAFQKIQTRVQSLMAITIGLQQVANVLNKDSAFQLITVAKAKELLAVAEMKVATAMGISTAAARVLMATLTLGLSIAITAIVMLINKMVTAAAEAKKQMQDFNKAVADTAAKPLAALYELSAAWENLGDNIKDKAKYIKENADKFDELGIKINDVNDAEKLFSTQGQERLKEALIARAKAFAAVGMATDKYREALMKQLEIEKMPEKVKRYSSGTMGMGSGSREIDNPERARLQAEMEKLEADGKALFEMSSKYKDQQNEIIAGLGLSASTLVEGSLRAIEETISKLKEQYVNAASGTERANLLEQIREQEKILEQMDILNKKDGNTTAASDKEYDAAKDLQKKLLEIKAKTSQLLFDQREDNLQKTLDQIDREHRAELDKVDDFRRELINKYNEANKDKSGFTPLGTESGDLDKSMLLIDPQGAQKLEQELEQLSATYAQRKVLIQQQAATEVETIMRGLADSYLSQQQRELQATREKFNNMRAELIRYQGDITTAQDQALTAAQQAQENAINDEWFLKTSDAFVTLFGDVERVSSDALRKAVETARQIVDEKSGSLDPKDLESYVAAITKAEAILRQRNPFKALTQSIQEYKEASSQAERENALGNMLENASMAAGSISGVFNEITSAISQMGGATEQQQKTLKQIGTAISGASELAMGIATGNPMQVIQGSIKLITTGMELLDQALNRNIEKYRQQIESLEKSYRSLERATQQAMGTDVFKARADEIKNLQGQISSTWDLIREMGPKAGTKGFDENELTALFEDLQELQYQIEDIQQEIFEMVTQTSVKGLADDLANSLVEAFQSGEDAAEAFGEVANQVLQSAVKNALKMQLLEKPIQDAMKNLQQKMGKFDADGVFQYDGLSEQEAQEFRDQIAQIGSVYSSALADLGHVFDVAESQSPDKAITGAIQGVSEATAQILGGQMNAIRLNQAESLSLVRSQLLHMAEIAINTRHLSEIRDILRTMRDDEPLRPRGL